MRFGRIATITRPGPRCGGASPMPSPVACRPDQLREIEAACRNWPSDIRPTPLTPGRPLDTDPLTYRRPTPPNDAPQKPLKNPPTRETPDA